MFERWELKNLLMDSASDPDEYAKRRADVRNAVSAVSIRKEIDLWEYPFLLRDDLPARADYRFSPSHPTSQAAVVMGAVAYHAHLYGERDKHYSYSEMWRNTNVSKFAEHGERIASGITPQLESSYVKIDLDRMKDEHERKLRESRVNEKVVVTGLNGAGKTTLLNAVNRFTDACGLRTQLKKFPRVDEGPFAGLNRSSLSGEVEVSNSAMQYLFVADALDESREVVDATLQICDRHPAVETLVYGPDDMETTLLASRELFTDENNILWTLIIDRHPANALRSVVERGGKRRKFERELEQFAEQTVRFAALNQLPGVRWINTDYPREEENVIKAASSRVIETMINAGIVGRAMRNQGLAEEEASGTEKANEIYHDFYKNSL